MFHKKILLLSVFLLIITCQSVVPPCGDTELVIDGITITAEGSWYANHFPIVPPEGPPFGVFLHVYVENASGNDLHDFRAAKVTLYYENTDIDFVTFDLNAHFDTPDKATIESGNTDTLSYLSKDHFHSYIEEGTMLYGCVRLKWLGGEGTVATPPSPVAHLH